MRMLHLCLECLHVQEGPETNEERCEKCGGECCNCEHCRRIAMLRMENALVSQAKTDTPRG